MTNEEAKKMLKAKLECFKNETSGINYDCNMRLCDGCPLNYEQGNMGEQKESLQMAIKALEQQPCEDAISRAEALKVMCDKCPMYNCVTVCSSYRHIEKLPSVTPKTGHWIVLRKEYEFMGSIVNEPQGCKCSNCNKVAMFKSDFCPNCGAKMEVRANE